MMLAYEQKWDCVGTFDKFLLQTLAKLVKEGMSAGEFKSGDALATARLLFDCLIVIGTLGFPWRCICMPRAGMHLVCGARSFR